jgi:hypothetical protein
VRIGILLAASLAASCLGPMRVEARECGASQPPIQVCPVGSSCYQLCGSQAGDYLLKVSRQALSGPEVNAAARNAAGVDGEASVVVRDDNGTQVRIPGKLLKPFAPGLSLDIRDVKGEDFLHMVASQIGARLELAGPAVEPVTLSVAHKDLRDLLEDFCDQRCAWSLKYLSDDCRMAGIYELRC